MPPSRTPKAAAAITGWIDRILRDNGEMVLSVFDLFRIGIGPSSSHTVGPMRAARSFLLGLETSGLLRATTEVRAELFGSLGATGRGHGSDKAVILGLLGETPEGVDVEAVESLVARVRDSGRLALLGQRETPFREADHLQLLHKSLPFHPNGMRFTALDAAGGVLRAQISYSVGGGFVVEEGLPVQAPTGPEPPFPFHTAKDLLDHCRTQDLPVSQIMLANERTWRSEEASRSGLQELWSVMQ